MTLEPHGIILIQLFMDENLLSISLAFCAQIVKMLKILNHMVYLDQVLYTRDVFYVRREVDLMKTAKVYAYIMHIF